MVTTFTYKSSLVRDRCTQFRVIVVTDPQTNTNKPTDRTNYNTLRYGVFGCLKSMSIKLKTPLPANVACERLFSAAGRVFVPRRGRISDKRFEQQLLAYSNKHLLKRYTALSRQRRNTHTAWLYRTRRVIKVLLECMCLLSTSTYSSRFF